MLLKTVGEDISAGKCTMPVAKAMSLLPSARMDALWVAIRGKPRDPGVVSSCIATLEQCGAIDACAAMADELVKEAWRNLDHTVPDSLAKGPCMWHAWVHSLWLGASVLYVLTAAV
jgi:geranylgeranyl pyrophosphate synthase